MLRTAVAAILLSAVLVAPAVRAAEDEPKAPQKPSPTLAHVKLTGELGDRPAPDLPFGRPKLTYRGFLEVLRRAEADPEVQGVLLEIGEPDAGLAKLEGLRAALLHLKKSGKKLYAYAEELSTAGLVLGSAADRLAMPEGGMVLVPGVSANVLYLKGLFGILGIDWLVIHEKEYKTAFESFVRDRMSPEQREVLNGIVDQRYRAIVDAISAGRRQPAEKVSAGLDEAIFSATRARELGLIDAVLYRDQFEEELSRELGGPVVVKKDYGRGLKQLDLNNPFVLFSQLMRVFSPPGRRRDDSTPRLALVYADGPITSGKSQSSPFGGSGTVGSETLVKAIDEATRDESVKAIVLRVDSPGGSGLASDLIWRALMKAREKKPVIASLSNVAASGGYYIAMAAQTIVAEPGTITGSIGVIAARPSLERLLGFWGIRSERIERGKNAGVFDVLREPRETEEQALRAFVAGFYREFVAKVAKSRGLPEEEVEKVARGRVWTGEQAKERRLVDELGGLDRAMEIARKRAGLPEGEAPRVVELPEPPDLFESLSEALEMRTFLAALSGAGRSPFPALEPAAAPSLALLAQAPGAGRELLARLWRLWVTARDPALALLPFEIEVR